jgi:uncharacterized glyoxalase superfamily protein PhnB
MVTEKVIPVLVYDDVAAAHDFLVRAFGMASGGVMRDGTGQAVHGEVRVGAHPVWLHRASSEMKLASARDRPLASAGLVVHVADIDAHHERARSAGARVTTPQDTSYGQREYEATDIEGHRWWFSMPTPV